MKKFNFIAVLIADYKTAGIEISEEDLARRSIGNHDDFARPYLRQVVANAEKASGKKLLHTKSKTPLKYLGSNVTIGMINNYFSEKGSPEIEAIRSNMLAVKNLKQRINFSDFRESLAKEYAKACGLVREGLENRRVQECFLTEVPGDWKSPIFDLEDSAKITIQKDGTYISWITNETTVKELLDVLCDCVE